MLLTDTNELPIGDDWSYETKYDGFRCILFWDRSVEYPILKSRNGKILNDKFPEIINYFSNKYKDWEPYLPLIFDGEIVFLTNDFQSNFSVVQRRGKMTNLSNIESYSKLFPCHYIIFDLLQIKGKSLTNSNLKERKQQLKNIFEKQNLFFGVDYTSHQRILAINTFSDYTSLLEKVQTYNGEGIVAKNTNSKWVEGSRTKNWLKFKNWRYVNVIVVKFDQSNGFFIGAIYKEDNLTEIVSFKHGFKDEELNALISIFKNNGTNYGQLWELPPSICVTVTCIDFDGSKLREPKFHSFQHELDTTQCNWHTAQRQLNPIPENVSVTHPDKPVFPALNLKKDDYLLYLQKVAPYMLPFLQNRILTVIRFTHGVPGESFYQKNYPETIPNYVVTHYIEDTNFVICNNLETLLWLGNQLAIELHIPFQSIDTDKPTEIVFDLDPPSVEEFHLAVKAALNLKAILEHFSLKSFIKTSGGKGMQIYIPLPENSFTYEETGVFTEFVCKFLVQQYPDSFTTERMKKNRGGRLYLDYVQHREGKTIIAPYSVRGNPNGLVATPLFWEEVHVDLKPTNFTMENVIKRIDSFGNPFRDFREVGETQKQPFRQALEKIRGGE